MRPSGLFLAAVVLLGGCVQETETNDEPAPPGQFLTDARDDAPPRYDVLEANFTELSGSVVLRIRVQNYAAGLPLVDTLIATSDGDYFARIVPDPERRITPQVRAEVGPAPDGAPIETCWLRSHPTNPDSGDSWWIFLELLHNRTGLEEGGEVRGVEIETLDPDGNVQDSATSRALWSVHGGPNPYAGQASPCPIDHERDRVVAEDDDT